VKSIIFKTAKDSYFLINDLSFGLNDVLTFNDTINFGILYDFSLILLITFDFWKNSKPCLNTLAFI